MSDLRSVVDQAVGRALFDSCNYPLEVQPHVLGRDISSLRAAVTDSVMGDIPRLVYTVIADYGYMYPDESVEGVYWTRERANAVRREYESALGADDVVTYRVQVWEVTA